METLMLKEPIRWQWGHRHLFDVHLLLFVSHQQWSLCKGLLPSSFLEKEIGK